LEIFELIFKLSGDINDNFRTEILTSKERERSTERMLKGGPGKVYLKFFEARFLNRKVPEEILQARICYF